MHNVQGRMCVFSRLFTENWIILKEEPLEFFKTLPLQIKLLGRIIQKRNSKHTVKTHLIPTVWAAGLQWKTWALLAPCCYVLKINAGLHQITVYFQTGWVVANVPGMF